MRLVILGSLDWLTEALITFKKNKIIPELVILPKDRDTSKEKSVLERLNFKYYEVERLNRNSSILKKISPDLVLSFAFPEILSKKIIDIPKFGIVNFHSSNLPEFRGRHPVNWAMIKGEKYIGLCAHFMNDKIDLGDVIIRDQVPIERDDDIKIILAKLRKKISFMSLAVIKQISSGSIYLSTQDKYFSSYDRKRTIEDSKINWKTMNSSQLHRFINALSDPYPNAYSFINKKKINIKKSTIGDQVGKVIAKTSNRNEYIISTIDGVIMIKSDCKLKIGDIFKVE